MKVQNNTSGVIKVAVNKWGDSGSTTYYTKEKNSSGSWSRSDSRGFVMMIERPNQQARPYYVLAKSYVEVWNNEVKRDYRVIQPIDN